MPHAAADALMPEAAEILTLAAPHERQGAEPVMVAGTCSSRLTKIQTGIQTFSRGIQSN